MTIVTASCFCETSVASGVREDETNNNRNAAVGFDDRRDGLLVNDEWLHLNGDGRSEPNPCSKGMGALVMVL